MEQQMSLFEEGGMKDDGLDRDPVSGNEIPPGSLAKEVRDDIPAQLSDGEYVVPADVVQYYGVKFFEDLRIEAKRGLAEMERTGRIGGEPIAVDMTMIAFGQKDKDKKEKKATGGVVGFDNGGVSADMQQVQKSGSFNPLDYAVPGFTPGSPVYQTAQVKPNPADQDIRIITYYHPTKGSKDVKFINGVVDPIEDIEFTQPPWSINKPTPSQQRNRERQTGSSNVQQKMNVDSWGLNPKVYNFNTWDRERFLKEAESQLKLSASERFITGFATLVNPFLGLAVRGLATGDGFAKTKVLIKMANAAGDEETANALQTMYDKAKESVGGVQGWLLNTETADKGISGAATLIEGQMSRTNPTFVNFANNNNLTSSYSSPSEVSLAKSSRPDFLDAMPQSSSDTDSGTVLATSDTENVANFGGRDVDVDATLSNFGLGNNNITKETLPAPEEPTIATDFATDDKDPVSAEEENLSEAYGGGEASKKFGMKKGGLATRTKKRRKK